ncbi:MAG: ABC transporter permease [Deltaproteobacteria bacterium]|nr:ABC transporter permease [Deltaproteobacteria bacterium]
MNQRYIKLLIYFILIVLLNITSDTMFVRVDLTKSKMFSISDFSKDIVSKLAEPLTIKVFFTPDLPAPHNNTERYLRDLLEEYASHGNRNFNYQFLSVSAKKDASLTSMGNQTIAESYDIKASGIRTIDEDEEKIKYAYRGLVLINGDIIEKIPVIESTDGLEYKITMAIKKLNNKISVISKLDGKIDVKLYMSDSLIKMAPLFGIDDISNVPEIIENEIEKLNSKYFNKIRYKYINPSKETTPEIVKEIKENNIFNRSWPDIPEKKIKSGRGAMGIVVSYKDKKITIPVLEAIDIPIVGTQIRLNLQHTREFLPDYLEAVIDINQNIGFLTSHSGSTLTQQRGRGNTNPKKNSLDVFNLLLSGNYTVKEVDLKQGNINESLKCLIIADPTVKFSDYELFQIDQALMRGTNLAFFIDPFKEVPASRQMQMMGKKTDFRHIDTGLEKLLKHYGITVNTSYVMDESCYKRVDPQHGVINFYFVPVIRNLNKNLPFMKDLKGLVTMQAAQVTISEKARKSKNKKVFKLFSSSEKSWEVKENINLDNPKAIKIPDSESEKGKKGLAYMLEGEFESYFNGKDIPLKKVNEKDVKKVKESKLKISSGSKSGFIQKRAQGKIFVIGTSKVLANNLLDQEGTAPNSIFIMNVLDAMNDLEGIAAIRGKKQGYNPIEKTDYITKSFLKGFNIAGLPILVVLFGGIVWVRRSARKKKIKKTYSKVSVR